MCDPSLNPDFPSTQSSLVERASGADEFLRNEAVEALSLFIGRLSERIYCSGVGWRISVERKTDYGGRQSKDLDANVVHDGLGALAAIRTSGGRKVATQACLVNLSSLLTTQIQKRLRFAAPHEGQSDQRAAGQQGHGAGFWHLRRENAVQPEVNIGCT